MNWCSVAGHVPEGGSPSIITNVATTASELSPRACNRRQYLDAEHGMVRTPCEPRPFFEGQDRVLSFTMLSAHVPVDLVTRVSSSFAAASFELVWGPDRKGRSSHVVVVDGQQQFCHHRTTGFAHCAPPDRANGTPGSVSNFLSREPERASSRGEIAAHGVRRLRHLPRPRQEGRAPGGAHHLGDRWHGVELHAFGDSCD